MSQQRCEGGKTSAVDWEVQDPWMLLGTVIVGAILMYVFNALIGPRWRALLRQQLTKSIHRRRERLGPRSSNGRSAIQSRRSNSREQILAI